MLEIILSVLIVILVIGNAFIALLLIRKSQEDKAVIDALAPKDDSAAMKLLLDQMNNLAHVVDRKLDDSRRVMDESKSAMSQSVREQFSESQKLIKDITETMNKHLVNVTKSVTETNEASKQVFTIADQLRNLEKTLKHQKQRGNLGEAALELILSNVLAPTGYKLQYSFANGETVDAVIMTKDSIKEGLLPIDAKFSLDNYSRLNMETDETRRDELEKEFKNDLKKRIDETSKYIRPNEGTLPFAFMFIPAEGIYYDLMVNEVGGLKSNTRSLIDYAYNEKKVIIVSPTTFAAYLQSVHFGLKAFQTEKNAEEIIKNVGKLGTHIAAYEQFMNKLGNSLGTTVNHYNSAHKELGKIDKDVLRVTGTSIDLGDVLVIEKPIRDEE